MGTNTALVPDVSSFPTVPGNTYRLSGSVRGSVTDADVANALQAAKLLSPLVWSLGSQVLPNDWPNSSPPPLLSGDRSLFAQGTWASNQPLPTRIAVGSGTIFVDQVWQYDSGLHNASAISVPTSSLPSTFGWMLAGGLLLAAGIGAVVYLSNAKKS